MTLKKKGDFDQVFDNGEKAVSRYFVLYILNNTTKTAAGFIASKKIGNAVKRNRAKRLLRQSFRNITPGLTKPLTAVFIARGNILKVKQQIVDAELKKILLKTASQI
ncbi:MAG: ribonuclease P protein component [Candidatus Margulisiibacteriota bacterium]|jgi:ribonuclease P protein component